MLFLNIFILVRIYALLYIEQKQFKNNVQSNNFDILIKKNVIEQNSVWTPWRMISLVQHTFWSVSEQYLSENYNLR